MCVCVWCLYVVCVCVVCVVYVSVCVWCVCGCVGVDVGCKMYMQSHVCALFIFVMCACVCASMRPCVRACMRVIRSSIV